jgi:hypothetical protein
LQGLLALSLGRRAPIRREVHREHFRRSATGAGESFSIIVRRAALIRGNGRRHTQARRLAIEGLAVFIGASFRQLDHFFEADRQPMKITGMVPRSIFSGHEFKRIIGRSVPAEAPGFYWKTSDMRAGRSVARLEIHESVRFLGPWWIPNKSAFRAHRSPDR